MISVSRSVLIVGPSWVGDMVMAQSLFIKLKQQEPDINIDVVAPPWSLPVLARMPQVRSGIPLAVAHGRLEIKQRFQTAKQLRNKNYQQAIVLPRSLKSALLPFFTGIAKRTGYKGEYRYGLINDIRHLDKTVLDQTVKKFVALGMADDAELDALLCPSPCLTIDAENQQQRIRELNLSTSGKVVAIMPGAEYGPAKQWPLNNYSQLIVELSKQGIECWIFGSAKEQVVADRIIEQAGGQGMNLCGRTSLADAVDLIAAADVAVSNDSGLMHIAAATQRPLVAIYGSSSPSYTPPLTEYAEIVYLALDCSPCFKRQCPLGHLNCLHGISVERILNAITAKL